MMHTHMDEQLGKEEKQLDMQKEKGNTQFWEAWTRNVGKCIANYFKSREWDISRNKGRGYVNVITKTGMKKLKKPENEELGHLNTKTARGAITKLKECVRALRVQARSNDEWDK